MFQALGVNIKQAYGMTEQTAASIIHRTDDIRLDTVGKPLPGVEFKVSDSGELLSRGDTIFKGYYKDPEATAEGPTETAGFIQEMRPSLKTMDISLL